MAKKPCCDKSAVKKGQWSLEEDRRLVSYIEQHGLQCGWVALPKKAGLPRCGKSCRLRWLNYLRPGLKRGNYSKHEEDIICNLYSMIGSRWSVMASQLQGRTDNDIKNYWNTQLKYKYQERLKKQLDFSAPLGNKDPESQGKEKQHHGSWKYPYTTTTSSSSSSSSMKTNNGIYNSSLKFRQTEYSLPSLTEYSVDRTPVSSMVSFGYNNDPNSTLFGAESTTSATDSSQSVSLWSHGQDTERDLAAATANSNSEASQGFYYDYDYTYDYGYDYDNGTFVGHAQPLYQESLTCSSPFTVDDSSLLFNIQS